MGLTTFQADGETRLLIPVSAIGDGKQTFRAPFAPVEVPYATTDPPAVAEYKPLVAIGLKQVAGRNDPCILMVDGRPVYLNDTVGLFAFWLSRLDRNGIQAANPPKIYLQLRVAMGDGGVGEPRWGGHFTLPAGEWDNKGGLLVQYGGLQGTQGELWGCVVAGYGTIQPKISLVGGLSRVGDIEQTITGQYVTTTP